MPEGFHPFPYRTRKLRPPGPMILGAQAPGKVGHRQVTSEKTISNEVVFSVSSYTVNQGPGFHPFGIHTAGVCVTSRSVAKGSSAFRHIAGVCVMSRNVAKVSSDFRHTAGVCVLSCSVAKGSPSPRSLSLGWVARRYSPLETIVPFVPGPMILGA